MSSLIDLMFGSGTKALITGSSESENEKYAVKEAIEESRSKESEIKDAEYREVRPLAAKVFGRSFTKRTPQEEAKLRQKEEHQKLKAEQKKQAERVEESKAKEKYKEAVKDEQRKRSARREVKRRERLSRVKPFTAPDYQGVFIPAFGMRKAAKESTTVSYSKHGVYPYDLVLQPVANIADAFVVTQSHHGAVRLSNPLFDWFGSAHTNSKVKGSHPLTSFGFV